LQVLMSGGMGVVVWKRFVNILAKRKIYIQ
jgi:hypothetical protein